ncbi:hypothetical protein I302_100961 [Kwoniella bestiolae CBS 10118]|uniref:Uncharacterized protein n=1 Tax=Kwoniella bestiolae CBS 10118 TaxID=1296100 RepID=A0A1B9G6N9_9TREE|nr:hypothetical protein I302_04338 [Kwoniella bestiolae CBS 10118]OCF26652.1 hypothetical protein I302_04338 [Kwoniella bestiolae CBS 10118]
MFTPLRILSILTALVLANAESSLVARTDEAKLDQSHSHATEEYEVCQSTWPFIYTMTDEDGWNRRAGSWWIYRNTGVELQFNENQQPVNPLPDEDVLFKLDVSDSDVLCDSSPP